MASFSPWFSGTPGYTYAGNDIGGSALGNLGGARGMKQTVHESPITVAMPQNTSTTIIQQPQQRRTQQQQQSGNDPYMKGVKEVSKLLKEYMNRPTDITGTGPSTPGYSLGTDLSGEAAIQAADLAEGINYGTTMSEVMPVAEGLTATGEGAGVIESGATAAEALSAAEAVGEIGTGVAAGSEAAAGGAVGGEAAASAAGGMSATGIGAIIAAAALAAILGIESSTGWNSQGVLDEQWKKGLAQIEEGDIGGLAEGWLKNPIDYAVRGGDVTAGKLFGLDPNMLPATMISNLFT